MCHAYTEGQLVVQPDEIEQATGINFMPLLEEPNPLEQNVDQRWLNN